MQSTSYLVSGPGCEGRKAPGYGPALSLAQTLASRASDPGTWYVRPDGGRAVAHIEREPDGSVTTRAATGGEPEAPAPTPARKMTLAEAVTA